MVSTLKIDNEVVNINLLILFSRLILLAERGEETTPCFEYELTKYPFTLVKDGMMRNGNKALLCSFLMKGKPNVNLPTEVVPVNDGEALLCQIKAFLCTKFSDIYKLYKKICTANMDTAMLCLIVLETFPLQKICNIQIELAPILLTLPSYQIKNV